MSTPRPGLEDDTQNALAEALDRIAADVAKTRKTVVDLVSLEWRRLRMRAVDGAIGAGLALLTWKAAVAAAMAGAVLVVLGVRNGAVQLFGGFGMSWLGDLLAGVLVLGVLFAAAAIVRRRLRRNALDGAPRPSGEPPE